jgi:uncharacterized surface protein with fasciclin (FAS1) repeats
VKSNRKPAILTTLVATLAIFAVACSDDDSSSTTNRVEQPNTIVDVASEAGSFTTLLSAVDAVGLTETLQSEGPFTVFAPTDAAFEALPDGLLADLLNDSETLTSILLYHVVMGEMRAESVVMSSLIETAMGSDVRVTLDGDSVMIGSASIVTTDIEASNGIIHVIDAVITPPGNIAQLALEADNLTTLVAALQAADLVEVLQGEGPFTVFAPTDAAFAAIPSADLDALLADTAALTDVLLYHVIADKLAASDVLASSSLTTAQTSEVEVRLEGMSAMIGGAEIIYPDIPASNGVIHLIDAVLFPPEM